MSSGSPNEIATLMDCSPPNAPFHGTLLMRQPGGHVMSCQNCAKSNPGSQRVRTSRLRFQFEKTLLRICFDRIAPSLQLSHLKPIVGAIAKQPIPMSVTQKASSEAVPPSRLRSRSVCRVMPQFGSTLERDDKPTRV
jgi:hypothetical protein